MNVGWVHSASVSLSRLPHLQTPGPSPEQQALEPRPRSSGGTGSTDRAFPTKEVSQSLPKAFDKQFFFLKLQKDFGFFQVQTGMAEESER